MVLNREGPTLEHQLLLYPVVNNLDLNHYDGYEENAEGYFPEYAAMEWFYNRYIQHTADYRNEYAFPLLAEDLSDLPSATVFTAGFDPFCDEGAVYADQLADAGVPVEHEHFEGMIHGFVSLTEEVESSQAAIDYLAD